MRRGQMRFLRIALDVVPVFTSAFNRARFDRSFLPSKRFAPSESLINLSGAVTFPRAQNVFQGVTDNAEQARARGSACRRIVSR